jgi:hypothetical protein
MNQFIELKTTDNQTVTINTNNIVCIHSRQEYEGGVTQTVFTTTIASGQFLTAIDTKYDPTLKLYPRKDLQS